MFNKRTMLSKTFFFQFCDGVGDFVYPVKCEYFFRMMWGDLVFLAKTMRDFAHLVKKQHDRVCPCGILYWFCFSRTLNTTFYTNLLKVDFETSYQVKTSYIYRS